MGDQIKRFCDKMEPEVRPKHHIFYDRKCSIFCQEYEIIVDNEVRKSEGEQFDEDRNCYKTKDRGREVEVCR